MEFEKWRDLNLEILEHLFSDKSIKNEYYACAKESFISIGKAKRGNPSQIDIFGSIDAQLSMLVLILERLDFYDPTHKEPAKTQSEVFVVHGHDQGAKDAVARFLERLGLTPVILIDQPNRGRTIIEKFIESADEVGFAVVLLTPDDLGGTAADDAQKSRARQNVIFELGYFVGSLGRGRACLLRKGEVEIPSDLYGVVYTTMDAANGWKLELARELKDAGFTFDADKVLA